MRITLIIEGRNRNVVINVQTWFCGENGIDKHLATLLKETGKAILLDFVDKEVWIPKSVYVIVDTKTQTGLNQWNTMK